MKNCKLPIWSSEIVEIPSVSQRDYDKEFAFQICCADWLRKRFEMTRDAKFAWWHHSANERSSASEGQRSKMSGQAKGFPDFINCMQRCAIELKVGDNKLRPDQKIWLLHFQKIGWKVQVIYTFQDFKKVVEELKLSNTSCPCNVAR